MNSQMVSWMKSNEILQVLGEERHVLRWHGHVLCHLAIGTPYTSVSCAPFKPCFGITTGSALPELNYRTTPSKACYFFLFHSRARPSHKYFTLWYFLVFVFEKHFYKYLCVFFVKHFIWKLINKKKIIVNIQNMFIYCKIFSTHEILSNIE